MPLPLPLPPPADGGVANGGAPAKGAAHEFPGSDCCDVGLCVSEGLSS